MVVIVSAACLVVFALLLCGRLLASTNAAAIFDGPPHPASTRDRRWDRAWAAQVLSTTGFVWPWPSIDSDRPICPEPPIVWKACQLVRSERETQMLTLDVFVAADISPTYDERTWVPLTLRAHEAAGLTSRRDIDAAVLRWVESGSPVDISLAEADGTAVLELADGDSAVTLELEKASPAL